MKFIHYFIKSIYRLYCYLLNFIFQYLLGNTYNFKCSYLNKEKIVKSSPKIAGTKKH